jgi:argininosuccinate lyase
MGAAMSLLALEKSLCFGYGRDLQEDKVPIFEAFECALLSLRALTGAIATATFQRAAMERALERGHVCATDLADFLVLEGLPFRDAHHIVGALVREAEERKVQLGELSRDVLASYHPALGGPEAAAALDPRQAVERRALVGGPARVRVLEAIRAARSRWGGGSD